MKRILIPTDFSETSRNALNYAIEASKMSPAELYLMHSIETEASLYTDFLGMNREFKMALANKAEEKLNELKDAVLLYQGVEVKTLLIKGRFLDAIKEAVEQNHIDLIIMGTLGASGIREKIWGSNTGNVIGRTKVPVLVIPHEARWEQPQKFLLATKYLEENPAILEYLFELAIEFKAKVEVGVFADKHEHYIEEDRLHAIEQINRYGELLRQTYQDETTAAMQVIETDLHTALEHYIKQNGVDVLVMITYQHEQDFWDRISYPSLTKRMSYNTEIPLLAIPAHPVLV